MADAFAGTPLQKGTEDRVLPIDRARAKLAEEGFRFVGNVDVSVFASPSGKIALLRSYSGGGFDLYLPADKDDSLDFDAAFRGLEEYTRHEEGA